jgi:putative nucleotidyltransferase with HDIG domain
MAEEREQSLTARLLARVEAWRDWIIKCGLLGALVLVLGLLFPRGESVELEYKIGAVWAKKDLIAPFSFPILRDEREYQRDVDAARRTVYDVFERDTLAAERQPARVEEFFRRLREARALRDRLRRSVRTRAPTLAADSARFARAATGLEIPFTDREWDVLGGIENSGKWEAVATAVAGLTGTYLHTGILDRPKSSLVRGAVAVRLGTSEEIVPVGKLVDQGDLVALLEDQVRTATRMSGDPVGLAYKITIVFLTPNVRYSDTATRQAVAAAVDAVPRTAGFVQENERVVSKHDRITQEVKLKLDSLRRAKADRGSTADMPFQLVGTFLHVTLVLVLYAIYLSLFRKKIFGNNRRLALVAFLILFVALVAYLTREVDVQAPLEYLIVVPVASMLLTIVFDSRVGFYGTVIVAVLVAGIRGNDYSLALASIVAGALSVYSVRDMKNRTQIFRSLVFIALGYALTILALGLERYESIGVMLEQLSYGAINAVISPVLTYGLLIFLEKFFRVTTDLTLVELAQFNHPLLRLLAERAPGTYHHSMTMASLAEAGAAAVGANPVLARVAAYFHDIGKIVKPTYFVENQKGSRNRHDKLAPRMSSLIIAAHVKDGMALAQEYALPEEIVDFIPMHHGTTRIDYFYNKARQLAERSDDETKIDEINEQDYRYPGPRPQTKETGIMMLADSVEAAVRSIDEPTPQRLEDTINELFRRRLEEGELDDSPLTMSDLKHIKEAFLGILVGIYHVRVKYPPTERRKVRKAPLAALPEAEEMEPPAPGSPGTGATPTPPSAPSATGAVPPPAGEAGHA